MNGVNESPGVYGEIADYWINSEEEEFNKDIENTEFLDYNDITVTILKHCFQLHFLNTTNRLRNKDVQSITKCFTNHYQVDAEGGNANTFDDESTILKPDDIATTNSDAEIKDNSDDFAQHKLIKHYYKLVPWIDYVL